MFEAFVLACKTVIMIELLLLTASVLALILLMVLNEVVKELQSLIRKF